MQDFVKTDKYDLRNTRVSEQNQWSCSVLQKSLEENESNQIGNMFSSMEQFQDPLKWGIMSGQYNKNMFFFTKSSQKDNGYEDMLQKEDQTQQKVVNNFSLNLISNYTTKQYITQTHEQQNNEIVYNIIQIKEIQCQTMQEGQNDTQSQDSQGGIFSQKISLIRGLQDKLKSLHQRLKIQSLPSQTYLNQYKINLEKDINNQLLYENFEQLPISQVIKQVNIQDTQQKYNGQSYDSEQLLIDEDFRRYERQQSAIRNSLFKQQLETQREHISPSLFTHHHSCQIQIIQIVRTIQIPLLIQINRSQYDNDKIQSKKSFYFQQNQQIHKTFQEFTQRQLTQTRYINNSNQLNKSKGNLIESATTKRNLQQRSINFDTHIQHQRTQILTESSLSLYHNEIKQRLNNVSFCNNEQASQVILSKILQAQNGYQTHLLLQEKYKFLEAENNELLQKIKHLQSHTENMQVENNYLVNEVQKISEQKYLIEQKLYQYKSKVQQLHGEFQLLLFKQRSEMISQYQQRLQQHQDLQAEYANRIIEFEQMFQTNKQKEQQILKEIQTRNDKIQSLKERFTQKCLQLDEQTMRSKQIQTIVINRQRQLKTVIEELQKENSLLNKIIHNYQSRCQEQGFYLLKEQAQEIRNKIQQKDVDHVHQLNSVEQKYQKLIQKYQQEIENMKENLVKFKNNKSISMVKEKNRSLVQDLSSKRKSIWGLKIDKLKMENPEHIDRSSSFFSDYNQDNYQELHTEISSLQSQNKELKNLLQQQKNHKILLSSKLQTFSSQIQKYITQADQRQLECDKNEQIFQKCVEQLEKQYELNKKLKQKIKIQQINRTNSFDTTNTDIQSSLSQQTIKVHPIYIQLSNKYKKSKKYAKILQKQINDLASLPQFAKSSIKCQDCSEVSKIANNEVFLE